MRSFFSILCKCSYIVWTFFTGPSLSFKVENRKAFDLPLGTVSQSVVQGKHEVAMQLHQDDTADPNDDALVEMRVYVPPTAEAST